MEIISFSYIIYFILGIIGGFLIYFHISDISKINETERDEIDNKNKFLVGLKKYLIKEVKKEKSRIFWVTITFGILLILSTSLFPYLLDKQNTKNLNKLNLSEEMNIQSKEKLDREANLATFFFSLILFIYFLIFSMVYISLKMGAHAKVIEAVKKETFIDLLSRLEIKEPELSFYKILAEKFKNSKDENLLNSLAKFTYDSLNK